MFDSNFLELEIKAKMVGQCLNADHYFQHCVWIHICTYMHICSCLYMYVITGTSCKVSVSVCSYWETLLSTMWPRFEHVMHLNIASIRDLNPQKLRHVDQRPHYVREAARRPVCQRECVLFSLGFTIRLCVCVCVRACVCACVRVCDSTFVP